MPAHRTTTRRAADRAYELVLWISFAHLRLLPVAIPLIVIARTTLTDAFRSIEIGEGTDSGVRIASNGSHWLVVWLDGVTVKGARGARNGEVLDATPITIAMFVVYSRDVEVAWDGSEALVAAGQGQPRVVILDYKMPGFNGGVTGRMLRSFSPGVHIIGVSAISDIRWLEMNTVRPSSASRRARWRTHRMPSGSRPLTGSSRTTTGWPRSSRRSSRTSGTSRRRSLHILAAARTCSSAATCGSRWPQEPPGTGRG